MPNPPPTDDLADWNPDAKWVRIIQTRPNDMVEFEFAVGEPQLFVEMVLPRAAFTDFCAMHQVTPTHGPLPQAPVGSEAHEWDWSLEAARKQHFRHEADAPPADQPADTANPGPPSGARAPCPPAPRS